MAGAGYKLFNAGDVLSASDVNTYMMQQTVMVFANSSARTSALSSVLAEGMVSYLQDTNSLEVYDGSAWVGATGDITGLTAGTGVSITSATGPVPTVAIDTAVVPQLGSANSFTTGPQTLNTGAVGSIGLIVKGASGQTANLQEWQDSSGNIKSYVANDGAIYANSGLLTSATAHIGTFISGVKLNVNNNTAGNIGLVVRGAASQTANLQEWQTSAGTANTWISSGGGIGTNANASLNSATGFGGLSAFTNSSIVAVSTNTASYVGILVRGVASQTADLQQWQNSGGTVLSRVNSIGRVEAPYVSVGAISGLASVRFLVNGSASEVGIVVRGATSQTASLQEWQSSAGTVLAKIASTGDIFGRLLFGFTAVNLGASVNVGTASTGSKGIVVRGQTGQTANLQEWQDSAGTVLASVDSGGFFTAPAFSTGSALATLFEENSGGRLRLTKATAANSNPGANVAKFYLRDGTAPGTLKFVVRAGAAGAETTILDNIPQ